MKRSSSLSICFFSITLLCTMTITAVFADEASCTRLSASGNPEYPPYLWRDLTNPQRLIGANAQMIEFVANELDIEIDLFYSGPWGRTQEEVSAGRVDLIAGAFYTTMRSGWMDYIYPEFQGTRTAVWTRADASIDYQDWIDLKPYLGVTVINNSFGQSFDTFAREELNIMEVSSLSQALNMVAESRVDYLIYEDNPGMAYAEQLNIENLKLLPVAITSQNLYLTISRLSPCNNDDFKEKLSQALLKLQEDEMMPVFLERAREQWREQTQQLARDVTRI